MDGKMPYYFITKKIKTAISDWTRELDWGLLFFLIFFLNVKLVVKIIAILAIYLIRFNFRFDFHLKNSRLPLFYLLVIGIGLVNFIGYRSFTNFNYNIVFFTGVLFWMLCILAVHQIKLYVDNRAAPIIHQTILLFFLINAIASLADLFMIIRETGTLNPYRYQGDYQKYFISTGDYIKGISRDTSTTNAIINACGVIYFLTRKHAAMMMICMIILLLTASNFINITLLLIFFFLFLFRSDRHQKSFITICTMLLVVFMIKVSPQNNSYIRETYLKLYRSSQHAPASKSDHSLVKSNSSQNEEERKQKIALLYLDSVQNVLKKKTLREVKLPKAVRLNKNGKPVIPEADIHSVPFQSRNDTTPARIRLLSFMNNRHMENSAAGTLPGKVTAVLQTWTFFQENPEKAVTGNGIGNFSSKLAFRATGLKIAGGYPSAYIYIHPDFLINHLNLYLDFFSRPAKQHSLINAPNAVYLQLAGEYGMAGLLVFTVYYLWFFARHFKKLSYGTPLLLLLTGILFTDYWFEQLSVIILFELMLLLDIKENTHC